MNETTIAIKNDYGEYTITVPQKDVTLAEMMEKLVRPILRAAGYPETALIDWFESEL